jgi:hypothetical protein
MNLKQQSHRKYVFVGIYKYILDTKYLVCEYVKKNIKEKAVDEDSY